MRQLARLGIIVVLALCGLTLLEAQQPPPPNPAQNPPAQDSSPDSAPTLRVNTSVVLVPTLVEKPDGRVLYGLKQSDFVVEDNGVPQAIHVDDDLDSEPVSVVVAIEKGRSAALQFQKISKLGPLLDLFTGDGYGSVALVTFDSEPQLVQNFTPNGNLISRDIQRIEPGDGGAAVLDAARYAVDLLEQQPPERRRVLLLISESRDHGSKKTQARDLVERIGTSNTLVLSLTYSASGGEFMSDLKTGGEAGPYMNLMSPLLMAIAAMHKNVARELAVMSGGEYAPFNRERSFEQRVAEVANHARNRYILSFRPTDTTPGLHLLKVRLTQDYGAHLVARASYWAVTDETASAAAASK